MVALSVPRQVGVGDDLAHFFVGMVGIARASMAA